jgi:hypothetical protein
MARSIEEILNQILDAKNSEPALVSLNSSSKVSLYRLFAWCVATATHIHERTWELFKADLEKIADEANVGTAKWLQRKVLEFQHGSSLVVVNDTVKYNTIDNTKRIITRCSIKENSSNRNVSVKVAKSDGLGGLTKLDTAETAGLKSYLNQIKMAGTKLIITTLDADRIAINADVYYDAAYLPATVKSNVITAINSYLANIDFNGNIYLSQLTDVIQSVEGVKDVVLNSVKGRMATDAVSAGVTVQRMYESNAGYVLAENTTGYKLDDTIILKAFE